MVTRRKLERTFLVLIMSFAFHCGSAGACDGARFSAVSLAEELKEAILTENYATMAELAGGKAGPGAPHPDFIIGGKNSAEDSIPFKEFLKGPITTIVNEVFREGQHFVSIAYVSSTAVASDVTQISFSDIRNLTPYRDYYICQFVIHDMKPTMPNDFCFSESGALLGE